MVSKIATLKDRNGNKLLPRTVFEAVQNTSGDTLDNILNNKLNKTDVVNTNTETVLGKALDATQNNPNVDGSLANQIGVLPTLKTTNKENLVGAINESVDEITALQGKSYIDNGYVSETENIDNYLKLGISRMTGGCTGTLPMGFDAYIFQHSILENKISVKNSIVQEITITHYSYPAYYNRKFFRTRLNDTWAKWKEIATTETDIITIKSDLGITPIFITPKVTINGNTFSISGGLKLTKPIVEGTVVMSLPNGIVPKLPYHIFFNSWNYDIPHNCRLWVDTDGNIKIYGASQFPTQEIDLDFSRTVTF